MLNDILEFVYVTLCTLQTQMHSRSGLKLFCLIYFIIIIIIVYGAPAWRFVCGALQIAHCIALYCT